MCTTTVTVCQTLSEQTHNKMHQQEILNTVKEMKIFFATRQVVYCSTSKTSQTVELSPAPCWESWVRYPWCRRISPGIQKLYPGEEVKISIDHRVIYFHQLVKDFKKASANYVSNCPVNSSDIDHADKIFGPERRA